MNLVCQRLDRTICQSCGLTRTRLLDSIQFVPKLVGNDREYDPSCLAPIVRWVAPFSPFGVPFALSSNIDYGMLIKQYASTQEVTRYSPAQIIRAEKQAVFGRPDFDKICTSHIESFNQTYRQQLKRFSRLTNAHSKSLEHHEAMQAIYMASYNFCRVHGSLKGATPAMASGLAVNRLELSEILGG